MMASQTFFIDPIKDLVQLCRQTSPVPIFLGGAGFSIAPKEILAYTQADFGLTDNAINTISEFVESITHQTYSCFPGCVYKSSQGDILFNPPDKKLNNKYSHFPFQRNFANLERYFTEGGQIGIETKRGCSQHCTYCVENASQTSPIQLRTPQSVLFEIQQLLNRGINVFHWCDSEFNLPIDHALQICDTLIQSGINKYIQWYTYCAPVPFTKELALKMSRAGCVGINFSIDSLHSDILHSLQKSHRLNDIQNLIHILRKTDIAIMFDLLLGSPGETRDTVSFTIENALNLKPDVLGISFGVRLYPSTKLAQTILSLHQKGQNLNLSIHGKPLDKNPDLLLPTYYLSPELDTEFINQLKNLARANPSIFLSLPATEQDSYSYCNHDPLINAIRNGARGAYWHILHQYPAP